jgi:hypothetical protein
MSFLRCGVGLAEIIAWKGGIGKAAADKVEYGLTLETAFSAAQDV